jgi:GT2 family glycosyltransferase
MEANVAVLTVDVATGPSEISGLGSQRSAHILFMYRDQPICRREVTIVDGRITRSELVTAMKEQHACPTVPQEAWNVWAEALLNDHLVARAECPKALPPCTVLICTRDRPSDLRRCLSAICSNVCEDVEVIVVDNDPSDAQTRLVASEFPVRYFQERRRGLNWARARGVRLARHEVILLTDDDVVVRSNWVNEMRRPFLEDHVAAVTGAVEPLELNGGQYQHEQYSSFYRGFKQKRYSLLTCAPPSAGQAGAGASLGIRRSLAIALEVFDAELDAGTAAKSGGDAYALYRILRAGFTIVFNPRAIAWHRHRTSHIELENMLHGYSVGLYCMLLRALLRDRDPEALLVGLFWFRQHHLRELWRALRHVPNSRPLDLIVREIRGVFDAPLAYWRCRRREWRLGPLSDEF